MNNITEVAEHILLPHQCDWSTRPRLERLWRSNIEQALAGQEDRSSVRPDAWKQLSYQVKPFNHVERARFDDRMRAGIKAGKLAVPLLSHGVPLASDHSAGATTITLSRSNHRFTAGKYVFIQPQIPAEFDIWDVCLIDSVNGAALTIAGGLDNDYTEGTYVWPLLFGRPRPDDFEVRNSAHSRYKVEVLFDQRQINGLAADDFESYDLGSVVVTLDAGEGWASDWVLGEMAA